MAAQPVRPLPVLAAAAAAGSMAAAAAHLAPRAVSKAAAEVAMAAVEALPAATAQVALAGRLRALAAAVAGTEARNAHSLPAWAALPVVLAPALLDKTAVTRAAFSSSGPTRLDDAYCEHCATWRWRARVCQPYTFLRQLHCRAAAVSLAHTRSRILTQLYLHNRTIFLSFSILRCRISHL